MEEQEDEETEEFEQYGIHQLKLAAGTASGYVGVRPNKSKKKPWQAWVHIKGEKRRCLGSFKNRRDAAVARAEALDGGLELLPSPRKQRPRKSGIQNSRIPLDLQ